MDDGVHHNGFYSPEFGDDEDCSSHASSSDWAPQPRIGMSGWRCLYLAVIGLFFFAFLFCYTVMLHCIIPV